DFNSVTTYSHPAAIRMLRAACGQTSDDALFEKTSEECYLFGQLRSAGYGTYTVYNHDWTYYGFADKLIEHGRADRPMKVNDLPVEKINFNETPVYSDTAVLSRWMRLRNAAGKRPAVLYYSAGSLHLGTRLAGKDGSGRKPDDRTAFYRKSAEGLTSELERFFDSIRASGRKTAVFLIGEHGAALRGSRIQAPDLRNIPLPSLTIVPVAVKIIGPGFNPQSSAPLIIDKPVSYLALAELISVFIKRSPFSFPLPGKKQLSSLLTEIKFVSENQGSVIVQTSRGYLHKFRQGDWVRLPLDAVTVPRRQDLLPE
ncbi:MAG: cellulose biosynthesis protein BcsG, partial [bacterium]